MSGAGQLLGKVVVDVAVVDVDVGEDVVGPVAVDEKSISSSSANSATKSWKGSVTQINDNVRLTFIERLRYVHHRVVIKITFF